MLNIKDFRSVYPEYDNLTDYELSTALHRTHYADMPYEQFAQNFGGPLQEDKVELAVRDYNAANPDHPITAQDIRDKDRSGLWGGIRLLGEGIYDAVSDQFPEDLARAWRAGEIDPNVPGIADRIIQRQMKDSAARVPSLQEVEGDTLANSLYQGPKSIATSVATGITGSALGGAAGGLAGSVVPGVGTAAGGLAGSLLGGSTMSGVAFYRMAKDQFVDEVQQAMQASMGRTLTSEEAAELNKAIDADATEFGYWEAVPEAASQFFTLGLIKGGAGKVLKKLGLGKMADAIGKRALTRIPAKIGAELGEEETTEGITYMGQEGIRQRYGLRPDAPSLGEFIEEQAGPVAVGSLLQLGGMRAAESIGRRMRRRAGDVNANTEQKEETATPSSPDVNANAEQKEKTATPSAPDVNPPSSDKKAEGASTPAMSALFSGNQPKSAYELAIRIAEAESRRDQELRALPTTLIDDLQKRIQAASTPGEFISEADMADIDAFVRDYEAREQAQADASMLSEYGRPEARRFTPLQSALEAGKTIDLLSLPSGAAGVAQGIGGLALPPGTGAIPMGTDASSREPIAPPTDFSGTPLVTPFTPRPALAQQAGPSAGQGRWAGGRSQLAYGGGMMQGLGFVGGQPSSRQTSSAPAMPTQNQITGIQQDPRADTMSVAENLGMPTPKAVLPEGQSPIAAGVAASANREQGADNFLRNHVVVGTIPGSQREERVPTPQVEPGWSYSLPSFVTAPYRQTKPEKSSETGQSEKETPKAPKETRKDLLSQLSPESRKEARRLTNAQIRERVRAERNPVKFDRDAIGYTVEDYPMPTAPSGTAFTSASGRRMAPFPQVDYSTPRKHKASNAKVAAWLLDEARKETAPNEWRSLMIRGMRADNLSPADVRELVDILSNGVEKEVIPPLLKSLPAETEPTNDAKKEPGKEDGKEAAAGATQAEQKKERDISEPQIAASEAQGDMVKSDPQTVETKRNTMKSKENSHAQTDAQGLGVDDSGSDEEQGTEYVSRAEGKRGAGRSRSDAGSRHRGKLRGDDERYSESSQSDGVQGSAGESAAPDNGEQHSLGDSPEHGAGVHGYGEGRGGRGRRGRKPDSGDARTVRGGERRGHGEREGDGSTASGLNYNAPVGALARTGSWKETAARNLDIIELSKRIDAEKRVATPEEQALLVQYVGWGPSDIRNRLFPSTNGSRREINPYAVSPDWRPLAERAAEILSPEEVTTAFQSTQYAHYTSEPMIRAIWSGLQRLGFKGGNILEPGMGTGLFAVASPSEIMEKSKYTGVEMDKATARIARHLLPESNILNADFVKQKFPDNFFDLAIGNPPFSSTKILDDPAYKKYRFLLHDYFFAKSLDKVRPGGLLVFVTSKGTMDKADDKARAYMAERADLLGAIRLPQTAFKQNAGTEVVTDVLFLRKRQPGEVPGGESWQGRAEVQTPEGPALVNEYFARHPDMVLGEHSLKGSMYRSDEYTVLPHGTDIDAQFAEAVTHLPENVYSPDISSSADSMRQQVMERDFNPRHTKEGALYVDEKGLLRRLDDGSGVDIDTVAKLSDADKEWLKGYVELRDALKQAQYDQLQDGDWEVSLKKLNQFYDSFVKRYGFIREFKEVERTTKNKDGEDVTTSSRRYKRKRLFDLDVEAPLIEQLEKVMDDGRIVKAEFLKGRTIKRPATPQIKNTNDALMVSLDQRGILDLDHVAELAGKSRDAVIRELGDTVYEVPGADWQMADEYLSGDVVTKLEEAEAAAASDKRFRRNVEALRKVQPKPLEAKNISVGLGAPWIPTEHLDVFAREILGLNLHIRYNKDSGTFSVPDANRRSARSGTSEWGTPDRSPQEILSAVLNNQSITIRVKDAQGKTHTDATATTEANEKADKMRKAFESWIWQDAKRTGELVKIYNRTFNNIAPRRFDGSHLTLPGLSLRYKLYDHQKRAIWRIIQTGNVYLAHAVGAGKTLEMIVSGMEQRRLGLIQRPMYVVPNHMLRQFSSEFQDAYPLARIMVADEENFTGSNRRRFVAQAALNAPDAIVITHSAFKRIGTRPETMEAVTKDLLTQLEEAIKDSTDRISRSRLEQRLEQAKRRAEARFSKAKDQAVFFEDMGVDFLYVDEAHGFRKLDFVTNRDRVKGIDPSGSEMALDLYSKLEWLRKEHPGRSHVLASGTPVTNTMAELYTVMRYMDPDGLERDGLSSFDAWATMFGRVKADLEQNASGSYEIVERFAKFVNVPELMKRVRGFMDVLTMSQLGDLVKRPDLKTGQPINVVAQASPAVQDYLKNVLAPRIEKSKKWRPSAQEKGNPDPIVKIITDGRLAALDLRFVSELAENDPDSKLNLMIDDIIKTHHAIADREYINPETGAADPVKGGTQIVFSSVGFGEQVAARRGFDLRAFMMRRFKEGGIPASQVAWMGDYKTHAKKEAMFKEMRAGKIRLLIGSPQNMGTGVNVQKRLFKLHYLSPPWYPADVEQPHGRILRQGNQNPEVEINWYATKGTYDSTMWGMVARKARFIEQAFTGDDSVRTLDDISESSQYEMAAALAAGDERAIQLAGLNADIERLSRLERAHAEEQMRFRGRRRDIEHALEREADERAKLQTALDTLGGENVSADNFRLVIGKKEYTKQKEAGEALLTAAEKELARWTPGGAKARESISIGSAQGKCPLVLHMDVGEAGGRIGKRLRSLEVKIGRLNLEVQDFIRDDASAQGIATRLVNRLNGITRSISESKTRENALRREMESLQGRIGVPFPQEGELNEKIAEAARIQAELEEEGKKQAEAAEQQAEEGEDTGGMASLAPGEFLPQRRNTRPYLRPSAVQRVADSLGKMAKNAAPVRVVRRFEELPESIRKKYAGNASVLEGVYDPRSRVVWLVADNLSDTGRAAEVWAHEQIVHHGLRGLFSDSERHAILNQLWVSLGGMSNPLIRRVAETYGLKPRTVAADRLTVMEEVIAHLAEKRQAGILDDTEQSAWRKIVNAILRAWNRLVQAVSRRGARMGYGNMDALLADLGRYVMDGVPGRTLRQDGGTVQAFASMSEDMEAAGYAAWEQLQRDMEEWARQVDAFVVSQKTRPLLNVCRTPDALRKLGAPDLPMTMTSANLAKILSDKQDHQLPPSLVKQLPKALAEPIMIFESAMSADSFVILTELKHEGRSVMAAVHLDTERQRVRVNDIASAYKRGNEAWYIRQIEDGRLLYQDKKKSLAWARTNRLQLPQVRKLPSRLSRNRILTDADIVKPVEPPLTHEDDAPLASLSPRDILGMTVWRAAREAGEPEIRHLFKGDDLTMLQSIVQLPHWIAKQAPAFAKVYERQLRRMDERSAALKKSLETVPSMFGKDRLKAADMDSLRKLLWEYEGKEVKALEGVEKFLTKETLATGRELIKVNPEFYNAYQRWLDGLHGTKAAKAAMLEIRKSLDADLVQAHNRMASMSEMSDDAIKEFRQSIGHVPNYFPHHRYGAYFVQAKVGSNVVFRQHFDAFGEKAAMAKARKIVEEQREKYPDAEWSDGKNDRLPDEVLGAPIDSEAMEQIIRAATAKIGDKERAREINELLAEGVSDVLKARGWGSHGIQRKGIPGFETEDIARVLYDYKAGLNGWLTKMEAARDFSEALSNIDARQTPNLWKYTSQYVRDMLRNSDRVDRITGNIKTIAFAWYLGGSIKTALVNATQNLVVGVPRLQMDVMGGGREWLSGAQSALVDRMTGNRGKGLTDEEARLVQELYGESVITDAFMEEVRGQLRGISGATLWNKFTKVLGLPMSEVERFNRASLALAAFRAARGGKLKAKAREKYGVKGKASYEQAKAFASDVVRDAHFVYGKSNMPEFMRSNTAGRAMSSMYTFRTFTHNMVAMWIWALKTQGKEGAAFVAKSLGATMALGGVTALPLYATLMTLFQAVTGDDDDWTELIRSLLPESNLLRDVVCYGVPAIAGVNIGGSLQMETPLTKGLAGGKTPQEVLTDSIGDIIGIPYDLLVVKPSRVMEAHSKGNTWRMLEEAAPVAVKNGMQAWRLYSEGQTTMTGRPINDPGEKGARRLSSGESFGKLLGFQPVSSTKSYAAYAATRHADQVRSDKIDELTVLILKTYDTGDLAGRREANRKLREWNEKMKAEGKPHMLIKLKDVLRRVKSRRRENRVTPKAIQKREWQQAVWG